jgi:hypothetical protein
VVVQPERCRADAAAPDQSVATSRRASLTASPPRVGSTLIQDRDVRFDAASGICSLVTTACREPLVHRKDGARHRRSR